MAFSLKNHPFAVDAFFENSLVITYALPKEDVESLIPPCLRLDTFNDRWAFVAVALVQTKSLRPKGFPRFLGNDFVLAGYRIFVRYVNQNGKRLRGLYILKSETDKRRMAFFGNLFTHYRYGTSDMDFQKNATRLAVHSAHSALDIRVRTDDAPVALPDGSPFADWKEARRFAGPLPFTFTYDPGRREVLIIEGQRENWVPWPVEILEARIGFIRERFPQAIPANAFLVEKVDYSWKKGKIEKWEK